MDVIDPYLQKYAPVMRDIAAVANSSVVQDSIFSHMGNLHPQMDSMMRGDLNSSNSQMEDLMRMISHTCMEGLTTLSPENMPSIGNSPRHMSSIPYIDSARGGGRSPSPIQFERQKISTPFGEIHMMTISG